MAVRARSGQWIARGVHECAWTGLLASPELDTGDPLDASSLSDKTVQVSGTFGTGGSLQVQGSNDKTNWFILTDPQGNPLTFTAAGIEQVMENPKWIRPAINAGDANTNLSCRLISQSAER